MSERDTSTSPSKPDEWAVTHSNELASAFRVQAAALLEQLDGDARTSCDPDPPEDRIFVAEAEADHPVGRIRLIFGDREFEVRTSIRPAGRPWSIDLAYYLRAMGEDTEAVTDSMWIDSVERLATVIEAQGVGLRACLNQLAVDPERWWRAADALRRADEQ